MTTTFIQSIQQTADKIIEMSIVQKAKMKSQAEVLARVPNSQNVNVSAGFVTDGTRPHNMEILVEAKAPPDKTSALVRVQAIEIVNSASQDERYNQVSLHFAVDYDQARQSVEKRSSITREDIAELIYAENSELALVSVSDETGRDSATGQLVGKWLELDQNELADLSSETEDELLQTIQTVITKLEKTAQQEANAS